MRVKSFALLATALTSMAVQAAEPPAAAEGQAPAADTTTAVAPVAPHPAAAASQAAAAAPTSAEASSSQPVTLTLTTVPPPSDFHVPPGYRAVKRGLDTVYCTSYTPTGSKLPQTSCMSREQVEQIQRQAETERQMFRERAHPGGTSGG